MKLKGLRQSKNVEDRRGEVTIIPDGTKLVDGSIYHSPKPTTLEKAIRKNKIPIPTPRPKIEQTQVTPGKFKTKNKI